MNKLIRSSSLILGLFSITSITNAQVATGGQFTLDQSVIATGSGTSAGGTFKIEGTAGQSVAGQKVTNATFSVHSGFLNSTPFGPSAATVSVSGCVQTAGGQAIRNARVTISSSSGIEFAAITSSLGYFHFGDVMVGETYVIGVSAKRFQFAQPVKVITILDELTDLFFIAEPN